MATPARFLVCCSSFYDDGVAVTCMDGAVWQRVEELFHEALSVPAGERDEWLATACAGDSSLYEQVQGMLDADEGGRNPLEHAIRTEAAMMILSYFSSKGAA